MKGYEGYQFVETYVAHFCPGGGSWVDGPSFSVLIERGEEFLVWLREFRGRWSMNERHVEEGFGICYAGFVRDRRGAEGGGYEGAEYEERGYVEVLVGLYGSGRG